MERAGVRPEARTFNAALSAAAKGVALENCGRRERRGGGGSGGERGAREDPSQRLSAVDAASLLFRGMLRLGLAPTPATYTSLITAYGRAGRPADAIAAFEDARARGCERNAVVFASLASALERCSSISSGKSRLSSSSSPQQQQQQQAWDAPRVLPLIFASAAAEGVVPNLATLQLATRAAAALAAEASSSAAAAATEDSPGGVPAGRGSGG